MRKTVTGFISSKTLPETQSLLSTIFPAGSPFCILSTLFLRNQQGIEPNFGFVILHSRLALHFSKRRLLNERTVFNLENNGRMNKTRAMTTHVIFMLYGLFALAVVGEIKGKIDDKDPSFLDHNIDKHAIFALPLSQGAYDFDVDGFVPKLPLQRMGSIHKEMIDTIKKVTDRKKQIQNILSVSNTINKDLDQLKYKIEQLGVPANEIDKKSLKADGLIFLAGHTTLMCNFIVYFPDIMKQLLVRNPTFDTNVKWAIEFVVQAKIIKDDKLTKPINLAQQELEMISKDANYHNPYKYENRVQPEPTPTTTTTKKPRRKLQRGPRLSGGEL